MFPGAVPVLAYLLLHHTRPCRMGAAGQGKTKTRPKRAGKAARTGERTKTPAPASGRGQAEKPAETEKEIL